MAVELIIGIIVIIASVVLTVAVLLQSSKDDHLSGAIAGGAETFFGKSKGKTVDKKLNTLTIILSAAFIVVVLVMYIFQVGTGKTKYDDSVLDDEPIEVTDTTSDDSSAEE